MNEINAYFIKNANKKDYLDVVNLDYPFDFKFLIFNGMDLRKILYGKKLTGFSIYFIHEQKSVGYVYTQQITDNLYGIWGTYIAPKYRRKGLATELYDKSFEYIQNEKIMKCIGSVSYKNMPSIENLKKSWDGFLDNCLYILKPQKINLKENTLQIKRYDKIQLNETYELYNKCVSKKWIKFLDYNKNNFMDRIFGTAGCESYSTSIMRKILLPINKHLIYENNKLIGYIELTKPNFLINKIKNVGFLTQTHIFTPNINYINVIYSLLNIDNEVIYWIGNDINSQLFDEYKIKIIDKLYICYKDLSLK